MENTENKALRGALRALVIHDEAEAQREGLPLCLELQRAREVLAATCSTVLSGQRVMLELGVEGHLFNKHPEKPNCAIAGCVPFDERNHAEGPMGAYVTRAASITIPGMAPGESAEWVVEHHTIEGTRYWAAWYNRALAFFFFRPSEPSQLAILQYLKLERDRYWWRHQQLLASSPGSV